MELDFSGPNDKFIRTINTIELVIFKTITHIMGSEGRKYYENYISSQ